MKQVKIYCCNNQTEKNYPEGVPVMEIAEDMCNGKTYLGVLVNNTLKDMGYRVYKNKTIHFLDRSSLIGMDIYERSVLFLLYVAVKQLFPKEKMHVEHMVSNGVYCRFANKQIVLNDENIAQIKERMQLLVQKKLPIVREELGVKQVKEIFVKQGLHDKIESLNARGKLYYSVYKLDGQVNYYYNALAPNTSFLDSFDLRHYYKGMLLFLPKLNGENILKEFNEQPQKFAVLNEFKRWGKILKVKNVGDLNRLVEQNEIGSLIKISEALHEKKISQIADQIYHKRKKVRIILIAGPSSSGKTTFSKRLSIQLMASGLRPVTISTDDYFVDRELTPLDENGNYDFETIDAVDLPLFNSDLNKLINGEKVQIPRFSFEKGKREYTEENSLQISKKNVIIVEGIHALNPRLTSLIDDEFKYKIYISAFTYIAIDRDNRIPAYENRLLRRIIRDYKYRGYSAKETIGRWYSVREGEEKHIEPFMNEADVMFNSALLYELGVLKQYAEPILREVKEDCVEYSEAQRLLKFFSFFRNIDASEIPPTSLLREFLGGSSFRY